MLTALLLAATISAPAVQQDTVYGSPALRDFVLRAIAANRAPPATLRSYRAHVETEFAFVLRDTLGREHATQIEQLATTADWARDGQYGLHVVGYRVQSKGIPFSTLSFVRAWTLPTLYGDRLDLGFEGGNGRQRGGTTANDTIRAVHPLASDRERYYRFSRGDTVAMLRTPTGAIPIVRVRVDPRVDTDMRLALFEGELDFDAVQKALVRMRGRLVFTGRPRGWRERMIGRTPGLTAVTFLEFVNAEFEGKYWLPSTQRSELVAGFALTGDDRSVFRGMSRFTDYKIQESEEPTGDNVFTLCTAGVTFASPDTLDRFSRWYADLGATTAAVASDDFDDLAPPRWKPTGPPLLQLFPRKIDDVVRFNRVEGLYTGAAASLRLRDAAPGVVLRGYGGWAWAERTTRGGASVGIDRGVWGAQLHAERLLANTNDFSSAFRGGSSLGALLGVDDRDYVDRRIVSMLFTRTLRSLDLGLLQEDVGFGEDRSEVARIRSGLIRRGVPFLANRRVVEGRYLQMATTLELHPNVNGDFLEPGIGARLHYEASVGQLAWQRVEMTIGARRSWNNIYAAAHGDGALLFGGELPPQQLFELGGVEGLPGYAYKEFGGNQAALARGLVGYLFPVLDRPRRVWRDYVIPGLSPGVSLGLQSGWAGASTEAALRALQLLATPDPKAPIGLQYTTSRPTGSVRATADLRATFFAGTVSAGIARPLDHVAGLRGVFAIGETF